MSRHHSFKVDPTHRDVEPRDEVLDRRRRKRAGLLDWSLDTKSRIYRMRHGRLSIDPQADGLYLNSNNSLGDLTVHPSENVKGRTPQRLPLGSVRTQMNGGALRRRHETTLNALAARNENIEDNLLAACEGRLSKKMLEFEPSSDMTGPEQAAWANVVQEIVTDFKDPSTARGRLVNKIKGTHYSLVNRGNLRLATNFAELGNSLARRLEQASSRRLDAEESEGDVFQAVGSYFESSDDTPQGELHTLVHINEIQSSHEKRSKDIIAFGQIETEGAWDLTDELVGSIFRYMLTILEGHSVSGKSVCFTLCGHLLRIFQVDPAGFSTSAAYSFREEADYEKIVCAMAFLCGPSSLVLEHWSPSIVEALSVKKLDGDIVRYRLLNIRRLAISPVIWGSRTATWSAQAERLDEHAPRASYESLPLIIKSTWIPNRFYAHELEILEKIAEARSKCLQTGGFVPRLPYPVGRAINSIQHSEVSLADWKIRSHDTIDAVSKNSTMVTFCEPGVHVDEDLPTLKNHVRLHRSLTQTLGWLAEHGIHYRDLNNGNVLRNATGECVLIDFGNARYLRRPRGQTNQDGSEEVHISFDDARSGTLMFMSRRIHELTNLDIAYKKLQAQYEANLRQLHTIDDLQYRAVKQRQCTSQQKQLVKKQNQMSKIYHEHRYADDAESQFFLGMQQILFPSGGTNLFAELEDLGAKRDYWDGARLNLYGAERDSAEWLRWEDMAIAFRDEINICPKEIKDGLADGSLDEGDGWPYECEKQCYKRLVEIMQAEEAREEEEEKAEQESAAKRRLDVERLRGES